MSSLTPLSLGENVANQAVSAGQRVAQAIRKASASAGVDFSYLVAKATQESGLDPSAKAKTSSATGLFQFIDQTWLRAVKNYGDKYGLSSLASRISIGSDGVARVASEAEKKEILALRTNPEISSCMAAELTNENKQSLQTNVGGKVGATELYLAHFLGAGGACSFLSQMRQNPDAPAASILPSAASANRSVFYDKTGQARSLSEVYQKFAQKFETAGATKNVAVARSVPTTSYKMASLEQPSLGTVMTYGETNFALSSPSSSFTGISSYDPEMTLSSPFAAMMIAQMDMGSLTAETTSRAEDSEQEQRKKTATSLLGLAA